LDIDCPHCGVFSASGSAITILPGLIGKDRRKAVLIGHVLRKLQATTKRPLLTSDVAQRIVETEALPGVSAQADILVRWLGDNSPEPGRMMSVSLEKHGAIVGMTSIDGLHLLLNGLNDAGLIKWYAVMGTKQSLHLTLPGMKRYEELRAAPQQPAPSYAAPRHRHAAVLSTDIVGYSSLMAADEATTLAGRSACEAAIRTAVKANNGRFVKSTGDGTLSEFGSTVDAMRTALEILGVAAQQNNTRPQGKRIELRVGLAVGDVVDEGDDIFGDSVNLAARLQAEAAPGTVCIPEHVRDGLENKMELVTEGLGLRELKGMKRPVRVVQVRLQ
jgi:class 3 adenylate cyclase